MTYESDTEGTLMAAHERRIQIEHLHFGAPADPALLERLEKEVIGFEMDEALRAFFLEMNGLQPCYWSTDDESLYVDDFDVPLATAKEGPLAWSKASDAFGELWQKIEANPSPRFRTGMVCIPDAQTIFETDWKSIHGMDHGTFLFDAFHHFYGVYLRTDASSGTNVTGLFFRRQPYREQVLGW